MHAALATPAPWEPGGEWSVQGLPPWSPIEEMDVAKAVAAPVRAGVQPKFAGYVGGWMSVLETDRQDEIVDPAGLDVAWFLGDGWFNIHHSKDDLEKVGYPVLCEIRQHPTHGPAMWTEGPILDTPRGRDLMVMLRALKGTARKWGMSIQGPEKKLDPNDPRKVIWARITNVAITSQPAHWQTRIELVKSLDATPGLTDALAKFADTDPGAARLLWQAFVAKSLDAAVPAGNTGTDAGAAMQRESVAGVSKRRALTIDEAVNYLLSRAAGLGIPTERVLKALADLLHEGREAPAT